MASQAGPGPGRLRIERTIAIHNISRIGLIALSARLVAQGKDGVGSGLQVTSLSSYDDAGRATSSRNASGWSSDTSYGPSGQALVPYALFLSLSGEESVEEFASS